MILPVEIAGSGWYLPSRRVPSSELETTLRIPSGWIERLTGIRERRYVAGETTVGMAAAAAQAALKDAGLQPGDLDAIVGASTGPHQLIPCTAALVQRELGAPDGGSACFDVNATCLSFVVAFQTAAHLIASGIYKTVLIFSSELASTSLNPRERESAVLFGDAAAAMVLRRTSPETGRGMWGAKFATYASGAEFTRYLGGGTNHHPNDPATTPEMNMFHMRGPAVFRQATKLMGPFLDQFFAEIGWRRDEVDVVVPHQASGPAVMQLTERLGFHADQVVLNLQERGNCIAASIPLAFAEAAAGGRIRRGQRVLLVGTGAGLTLGALALTY